MMDARGKVGRWREGEREKDSKAAPRRAMQSRADAVSREQSRSRSIWVWAGHGHGHEFCKAHDDVRLVCSEYFSSSIFSPSSQVTYLGLTTQAHSAVSYLGRQRDQ
jgi:hypothetical protein